MLSKQQWPKSNREWETIDYCEYINRTESKTSCLAIQGGVVSKTLLLKWNHEYKMRCSQESLKIPCSSAATSPVCLAIVVVRFEINHSFYLILKGTVAQCCNPKRSSQHLQSQCLALKTAVSLHLDLWHFVLAFAGTTSAIASLYIEASISR